MKREKFELKLLDFCDGQLPEAERVEMEAAVAADSQLLEMYRGYLRIRELEESIAKQVIETGQAFEVKVMEQLEEVAVKKYSRYSISSLLSQRGLIGALGTIATVVLVLKIAPEVAEHDIATSIRQAHQKPSVTPAAAARVPQTVPPAADEKIAPPAVPLEAIPQGFRAVTIPVERRAGIEGYTRPGSKIDVLLITNENGIKKVSTINRNAEVVAAGGATAPVHSGQTNTAETITMIDPAAEAQRIELAKNLGQLSFALRSDSDSSSAGAQPDTITVQNLVEKSASASPAAGSNDGVMYTADPRTKKPLMYVLKEGRWSVDRSSDYSAESGTQPERKLADPGNNTKQLPEPLKPIAESKELFGIQSGGFTVNSAALPPPPPEPLPLQNSQYGKMLPSAQVAESNEQYAHYEENPRVATASESMSTFGADVDTASYTNARRFLRTGNLPPPDAVRIEEFINYFDYDYPVEHEKPFAVSYEIAPSPLDPGRHLLRLAIKARDLGEATKPWNLVFLVDVSGSMASSDKLPLVKAGLRALVEQMKPADKISLITYAGNVSRLLDGVSAKDKEQAIAAIDQLSAGGATYGEGGIRLAYESAERNKIPGGVNRVILATDGDFNVGVTSREELVRLVEEKRNSGVTLTTLGVGTENINDGTMEQLANKGNGNYFYLDSVSEARRVLGHDVQGTIEVVAKDLKFQLELNPTQVVEYRLIGYDNRRMENSQFNDDAIDSGEVGSGHTVTALYELVLVGSPIKTQTDYRYAVTKIEQPQQKADAAHSGELGFLKLRFKQPDGTTSELLEFPIARQNVKGSAEDASSDLRFAAAVAYFGHILRQSRYKGSYTLDAVAKLAESAIGPDENGKRREFVELVRNAKISRF